MLVKSLRSNKSDKCLLSDNDKIKNLKKFNTKIKGSSIVNLADNVEKIKVKGNFNCETKNKIISKENKELEYYLINDNSKNVSQLKSLNPRNNFLLENALNKLNDSKHISCLNNDVCENKENEDIYNINFKNQKEKNDKLQSNCFNKELDFDKKDYSSYNNDNDIKDLKESFDETSSFNSSENSSNDSIQQHNTSKINNKSLKNSPKHDMGWKTKVNIHENFTNKDALLNKQSRTLIPLRNVYDSISEEEAKDDFKSLKIQNELHLIRKIWNILILIFIIYSATFGLTRYVFNEHDTQSFLFPFEVLIDVCFLIDIVIQFFTQYYDNNNKMHSDKKSIALNYLKTWLLADLASSVPLSLMLCINKTFLQNDYLNISNNIFNNNNNNNNYNNNYNYISSNNLNSKIEFSTSENILNNEKSYINFLTQNLISNNLGYKLFRVLRSIKLFKVFSSDKNSRLSNDLNIDYKNKKVGYMRLGLIFLFLIHVSTCLWIFIGGLDDSETNASWFNSISGYWKMNSFDIYVCSLYFNLLTIYTVGYGDIISKNNNERLYNIFILLFGNLLFSFGISYLSFLFASSNILENKFKHKITVLEKIRNKHNVPKSLYRQIKLSIKNMYRKVHMEKFIIFDSLPLVLKREFIFSMHSKGISNLIFFKFSDKEFIIAVLPLLKTHNLLKDDILVAAGGIIEEIYLVNHGILSICLDSGFNNIQISQLKRNFHFGDILIYLNEKSPYTLKCSTKSAEYLTLSKDDYYKIGLTFDKIIMKILQFSCEFLESIEKRKEVIVALFDQGKNVNEIKLLMKVINFFISKIDFERIYFGNSKINSDFDKKFNSDDNNKEIRINSKSASGNEAANLLSVEDFFEFNEIKDIVKFSETEMDEKSFFWIFKDFLQVYNHELYLIYKQTFGEENDEIQKAALRKKNKVALVEEKEKDGKSNVSIRNSNSENDYFYGVNSSNNNNNNLNESGKKERAYLDNKKINESNLPSGKFENLSDDNKNPSVSQKISKNSLTINTTLTKNSFKKNPVRRGGSILYREKLSSIGINFKSLNNNNDNFDIKNNNKYNESSNYVQENKLVFKELDVKNEEKNIENKVITMGSILIKNMGKISKRFSTDDLNNKSKRFFRSNGIKNSNNNTKNKELIYNNNESFGIYNFDLESIKESSLCGDSEITYNSAEINSNNVSNNTKNTKNKSSTIDNSAWNNAIATNKSRNSRIFQHGSSLDLKRNFYLSGKNNSLRNNNNNNNSSKDSKKNKIRRHTSNAITRDFDKTIKNKILNLNFEEENKINYKTANESVNEKINETAAVNFNDNNYKKKKVNKKYSKTIKKIIEVKSLINSKEFNSVKDKHQIKKVREKEANEKAEISKISNTLADKENKNKSFARKKNINNLNNLKSYSSKKIIKIADFKSFNDYKKHIIENAENKKRYFAFVENAKSFIKLIMIELGYNSNESRAKSILEAKVNSSKYKKQSSPKAVAEQKQKQKQKKKKF